MLHGYTDSRLFRTLPNGSFCGSLARFDSAAREAEAEWGLALLDDQQSPLRIKNGCEGSDGSVLHPVSVRGCTSEAMLSTKGGTRTAGRELRVSSLRHAFASRVRGRLPMRNGGAREGYSVGFCSSPARRSTWAERGNAPKSRSGVPGG